MAPESATVRLGRLLTMVPWLLQHPGAPIGAVATTFDITPAQVEADLSLIFLCGTPGGMPQDLIEADWEGGEVYVGNADEISRPLRLAPDEALTLMVGLRALAAVPGLADPAVVESALAKLGEATGHTGGDDAAGLADRIGVELADDASAQWVAVVRRALRESKRLRIDYLNIARDELTSRDVDPMRLAHSGAHWYLEGWCHRARAVRLFRLDRMRAAEVLEADGTPPAEATSRLDEGVLYTATEGAIEVTLEVSASARWIADYYPHLAVSEAAPEGVSEGENGTLLVTLLADDPAWVRRLMWRLGGAARVVSPAFLASDIARGASRALDAYPEVAG